MAFDDSLRIFCRATKAFCNNFFVILDLFVAAALNSAWSIFVTHWLIINAIQFPADECRR